VESNYSCESAQSDPNFDANYSQEIANSVAPSIPDTRIVVLQKKCGSTIVTFNILPPTSPSQPSANSIYLQLSQQLALTGSKLGPLFVNAQVIATNQSELTSSKDLSWFRCTNGILVHQSSLCPPPDSEVNIKLILGLSLGVGLGFLICLILVYFLVKRKNTKSKDGNTYIPALQSDATGDTSSPTAGESMTYLIPNEGKNRVVASGSMDSVHSNPQTRGVRTSSLDDSSQGTQTRGVRSSSMEDSTQGIQLSSLRTPQKDDLIQEETVPEL